MTKKLLVTDYDGTLYQGGIAPHVREAIDRFRAAGHLFGVATGRDRHWSYELFRQEKRFAFDFVLAMNGALALDGEGNVLYTMPIDGRAVCGESTLARVVPQRIFALGGSECHVIWENERIFLEPAHLTTEPDSPAGTPWGSMEAIYHKMDTCLMLYADTSSVAEAAHMTKVLRQEFGQWLNPLQTGTGIDIPACGVDKGVSIARFAERMGIAKEDIWTAGDGFNDIAMLAQYCGCAMAGGVQEAKDAAAYICGDIADVIRLVMEE